MNRKLASFLILASTSFACHAQAQGLDGLCVYMEYQVIARNFAPAHWYFLPDGRYVNTAPIGGLNPEGLEAACAKWRGSCGTYKLSGKQLTLTPRDGKPWTAEFEQTSTGNWKIGGNDCTRVKQSYPANAKLSGIYTAGSGFGGIMSAQTYVFSPEGSFTRESVGSVRASGMGSATSTTKVVGSYRLHGNTLELTAGGQTTKHLIYELPADKGPQLVVDGTPWKKN